MRPKASLPGDGCSRRCRRWASSSATREPCCRSSTRRGSRSAARGVAGTSWALLPSAAGVIDPLLSTGFPLTLLGILRLLDVLERTSDGPDRDAGARRVRAGDAGASWTPPSSSSRRSTRTWTTPALFKRLSLLYFAAASYSETARRLGRPDLAPGFLLSRASHVRSGVGGVRGLARRRAVGTGADGRWNRASIAPSSPSTPPACWIAPGATGTRSSRAICSSRPAASTRRPTTSSSGCPTCLPSRASAIRGLSGRRHARSLGRLCLSRPSPSAASRARRPSSRPCRPSAQDASARPTSIVRARKPCATPSRRSRPRDRRSSPMVSRRSRVSRRIRFTG